MVERDLRQEQQPTITASVIVEGEGIEPWSQWSFSGPGYDFALPPSWPPASLTINGQNPFGGTPA